MYIYMYIYIYVYIYVIDKLYVYILFIYSHIPNIFYIIHKVVNKR